MEEMYIGNEITLPERDINAKLLQQKKGSGTKRWEWGGKNKERRKITLVADSAQGPDHGNYWCFLCTLAASPPHKIHFGFSVFFHKASSQASLPSFKMRLRSEEALNVTEGPSQMSVVWSIAIVPSNHITMPLWPKATNRKLHKQRLF